MKNSKHLINILFLFFALSIGFSQSGKVAGTIIDGDFTEPLPFANVLVKGTATGTTSDFDGKYNLDLDPGTYTLEFSFVGYNTQEITNVIIKANEVVNLDVTLNTNSLETVVVTTSVKRNTENAVLNLQKKSVTLLDGLSVQSIKKTGASNIASAVKSVPGVSVQGGKYVYVRGLGDRYTKSILNGIDIPGLDPDRNTIPMDIFPTNIIDNVLVIKSAAAQYPADFTGGIVNVVTKDFPTKAEYSISIGAGYNPSMHFKDNYLSYDGSKTDLLGFDNGKRDLPINRYQQIPGTFSNSLTLNTLTSLFDSQLGATTETSYPNYNFGFTLGNQYELGDNKIGYMGSFSYKNNTTFFEDREDGSYIRNQNDLSILELDTDRKVTGSSGSNEVIMNGLLGLTFKTPLSKYKATGLHIQNGESTAGLYDLLVFEAAGNSGDVNGIGNELLYTERSLTNLSLVGDHSFGMNSDWDLDWIFSPSFSQVLDKDHRVTPLRIVEIGDETQYQIDPSSLGNSTRIWRTLAEESWVFNTNLNKKHTLFNKAAKLKFGGGYNYKFRDFSTDQYLFNATSSIVEGGDVNNFLASDNLWTPSIYDEQTGEYISGGEGTYLDANSIFQPANSYEGEYNLASTYISDEFNASEKLKVILGLRAELFTLYYTGEIRGESVVRQKTIEEHDFFPSANFIYALTDQANLRASYSRTTARPSFKEASTAQINDPITQRIFIGGLDNGVYDPIRPTYINNLDVRYEIYREQGQMVAFSGFYKDFKDPIETVFFPQASNQFTVANLGDAQVLGAEFEFRQKITENVKLNFNASYIHSSLEMSDGEYAQRLANARVGETIENTRDLQGQSPFLINVGVDYDNNEGFRAGLFYNVQGKTLELVGTGIVPDVYTLPFHNLNFTLNKAFGEKKKSGIDFKVTNILGSERESAYQSFGTDDEVFKLRSPGTEISLGYSFKF